MHYSPIGHVGLSAFVIDFPLTANQYELKLNGSNGQTDGQGHEPPFPHDYP